MNLRIVVEGQSLRWYGAPPRIADDSIQFVRLQFDFPTEWLSLRVTAQFTQSSTLNVDLKRGMCFLPAELVPGLCKLSLFGYGPGEAIRATTVPMEFKIEESGFINGGEPPVPPTPDLYSQLLAELKNSEESVGAHAKQVEENLRATELHAINAATSEDNAKGSAQNAAEVLTAVVQAEKNAVNAMGATVEAARRAELSRQGAVQAEQDAEQFATDAAQSAIGAKEAAEKAAQHQASIGTAVEDAANSATAAENAKNEAVNAEQNAKTSEQNAKTAETNAEQSRKSASVSEQNAKTSEQNAEKSAEEAKKAAQSVDLPSPDVDNVGKALIVNETGDGFTFGESGGVNVTGATPGQMIIVKAVDDNGKPTEWEPVDRTHWVEDGGMTEIIPETTLTPDDDGMFAIPTEVPNLVAGDTYIVNWNDVEYNCVAQELANEDIAGNAIGNIGAVTGGTDTGEPFVILRILDDFVASAGIYAMIFVLDGSTSVTLSIYGKGEIVHKLDNKFLDLEWIPAPKGEKTLVPTFTVSNGDSFVYDFRGVISNGQKVNVIFDGVKYECTAIISSDSLFLSDVPFTDTIPESYTFFIGGYHHGLSIRCADGEHTLSISAPQYEKIPQHYLSELHAISSISGSVGEANQYLEQGYPVKYSNSFVLGAQITDAQGSYLAYAHPWGYRLYNNHFLNLLGSDTAIAAMLPSVGAKVGQHLEVVSTGEMTLFKTVDPWVLTAPDGTKYKLTVDNSGALSTEKVT